MEIFICTMVSVLPNHNAEEQPGFFELEEWTRTDKFAAVYTCALLTLLVLGLLTTVIVSSTKAYYLSEPESEPRVVGKCMLYFETLFSDKRSNSLGSAFYYVIYMVRRVLIVSIALWMYDYPML